MRRAAQGDFELAGRRSLWTAPNRERRVGSHHSDLFSSPTADNLDRLTSLPSLALGFSLGRARVCLARRWRAKLCIVSRSWLDGRCSRGLPGTQPEGVDLKEGGYPGEYV
jgi:hypothetical protein